MPVKKFKKKVQDNITNMSKMFSKIKKGIAKTITKKASRPSVEVKPKKSEVPLQVAVGESKFYLGEQVAQAYQTRQDLPGEYYVDKIVLQTRDPWWLHTYWEVTAQTFDALRGRFKDAFFSSKRTLRVYDISNIIFDGTNAHRYFDIEVGHEANNWYIDTQGPGRSWCVDFGLKLANGEFITIVRSNTAHTPLDGPSWITDEEWMIPEDLFSRIYGMGIGFGSSPVGIKRIWQEKLIRELGSGAISSVSSPVKRAKQKGFWLVVNAELIIYGATEPDAKVTVQNRPINLRPDGTFSLRFALPDGKQVIPVRGISSDGSEERRITPIVTRETK